jgi:hypothetical protein
MLNGRVRSWAKRVGLAVWLLLVVAGAYAALNWNGLNARYAGHRLRGADGDDERARWAGKLLALGDAGAPYLTEPFRAGGAERCAAVVAVLKSRLAQFPPTDPRYTACCRPLLDGFGAFSEVGKAATAELVPELLQCSEADAVARCRDAVRAGLAGPTPADKVRAIRLALRSEIGLSAEVPPLLNDAEAEVRRAAMLAVGPALEDGNPVVGDEELFRWLHDPDADVRDLCQAALMSRGLDAAQIQLARQLTDPNPAERLKLLVDLRWAGAAVRDPGPWLERLSRDPDPAVRLGAARVAFECRLVFAGWLDRLATQDPDPTVRRWSGYYRDRSAAVRQTQFAP